MAVLVVSDDLDELFEICDNIAVIAGGRLSAKHAARDTNAEAIGLLMGGSLTPGRVRAASRAPRAPA